MRVAEGDGDEVGEINAKAQRGKGAKVKVPRIHPSFASSEPSLSCVENVSPSVSTWQAPEMLLDVCRFLWLAPVRVTRIFERQALKDSARGGRLPRRPFFC